MTVKYTAGILSKIGRERHINALVIQELYLFKSNCGFATASRSDNYKWRVGIIGIFLFRIKGYDLIKEMKSPV